MSSDSIPGYDNLSRATVEMELNTEFRSLKSGYDTFKAVRLKMYREYKFQKYGNEVKGQSTIVDSTIWDAIEWILPAMIQPYVETNEFIKISPQSSNFKNIVAAQVHRELLANQIKKKLPWYQIIYDVIKGMLIQRESFAKIAWQEADPDKGEPVSRPILTSIPASQIRYDWNVINFLDSHVVTQEEDMTRADIIALMKGEDGVNESVFNVIMAAPGRNTRTARLRDESTDQPNWVGNDDDKMNINHTLYLRREHWTTYSLEGNDEVVPVMAVFIDDVLVQLIENPTPLRRPPFFQAECVRDVLGNPAQGIPEILSDIQMYKTGILRMTSDNLNAQMNGLVEYDQNNVDDVGVQLLKHAPKGARVPIPVNKMGSVNPLPATPIAAHAFTVWELLEVAKENRSGFTRYSQGNDSKSLNQTATGIVAITQRSEMRVWEFTKRLGEMFFKPVAEGLVKFNQTELSTQDLELQFGSPEYRFRDNEGKEHIVPAKKAGDWITLSKKDLGGHFTLELDIQSDVDKQTALDNGFQWAQFFGPYVGQGVSKDAMSLMALKSAELLGLDEIKLLQEQEVKTIGEGGVSVPVTIAGGEGPGAEAPENTAGQGEQGTSVPALDSEQGLPGLDPEGLS